MIRDLLHNVKGLLEVAENLRELFPGAFDMNNGPRKHHGLRNLAIAALTAGLGISLFGCGSGGGVGIIDGIESSAADPNAPATLPTPIGRVTNPVFNPASGNPAEIPLPNDLLRNPQTGFVDQLPNTPTFNAEPFASLKSMRGFSTTGNIVIPFSGGVVPSSVDNNSVRVIDTVTNTVVPCTFEVLNPFVAAVGTNSTIIASPIRPLRPLRTYSVVLTSSLQGSGGQVQPTPTINIIKNATPLVDGNGKSVITGLSDANAAQAEVLRAAYQPIWSRAETASGISRTDMVFAFQFGTQPLFAALPSLRATAVADNRGVVNSTFIAPNAATVAAVFANAGLPGSAAVGIDRIIRTQIVVRDYIGNPTTGFFQGTGFPGDPIVSQADKAIPCFVLLPDPVAFPGPRPSIIFQHGITRSKSDSFSIAGTLCSLGFAVIAPDMVLHGELALPGQASGTGFINLSSLRTGRDNLRQSAANLFYVTQAIMSGQTDVDGVAGPELAPISPFYIGQSLGSIVGTMYSACEPNNKFAALSVPGGRIGQLLLNSNSFASTILAGLAAQGITPGTATFTQFWLIAQTVIDDGDPMNYGTTLKTGALRGGVPGQVLIQEAMADTTIPNSATHDLANAIGINQVNPVTAALPLLTAVNAPFAGSGLFQFPGAKHGFLLDPTQGNTAAARQQILTWFSPAGPLGQGTIIVPAPFPKELQDQVDANTATEDMSHAVLIGK